MSDFEEKLNKLLNDPAEMERFAGFAKSLMSGADTEKPAPELPELDPKLLSKIGGLMSGKKEPGRDERLLEAMRPFLSEKRRGKMDRAIKIARLAGIAEIAASQLGGEDDVGI